MCSFLRCARPRHVAHRPDVVQPPVAGPQPAVVQPAGVTGELARPPTPAANAGHVDPGLGECPARRSTGTSPGRDELLTELVVDAYDSLGGVLADAATTRSMGIGRRQAARFRRRVPG